MPYAHNQLNVYGELTIELQRRCREFITKHNPPWKDEPILPHDNRRNDYIAAKQFTPEGFTIAFDQENLLDDTYRPPQHLEAYPKSNWRVLMTAEEIEVYFAERQ